MPITSSAKKALRASYKKRVFNLRLKANMDLNIKKFRKLIAEKKVSEAKALVPSIYQAFDKAVKKDYIKANAASRSKSRVMHALKKAEGVK
jgi:ribosomal protein S20